MIFLFYKFEKRRIYNLCKLRRKINMDKISTVNPNDISDYEPNFTTSQKLLWQNNNEINLNDLNEEIMCYENIILEFNNREKLYKRENPKVTLVIPAYNQDKFINKIYASIEQQNLKDIEIIFVDDFSEDNSEKIINELMEIDKRIVYIKNKENKGVLYSRNKGILNAKGEYVLCLDIEDYLLNDILMKSYITAKKYNLEILQFYVMKGDSKENTLWDGLKYKSGIIRKDDVKKVFFLGPSRNIWDKFVKREIYIKSIEFMNPKFGNDKYIVFSGDAMNFGLFKVAKSYGFLEEVGYIYNLKIPNIETHSYQNVERTNAIFKTVFTIMEYFYEQSDNRFEKQVAYNFYSLKVLDICSKGGIDYISDGFDYIVKILNLFLNSEYFDEMQKKNYKN